MANLKEVRQRIQSVVTTQQITKAMKLVAASKLKRSQDRILKMRPYSEKLSAVLGRIVGSVDVEELNLNLSVERNADRVLIVLLTSDKGLCGGFNSNLIKKAKGLIYNEYAHLIADRKITLMPLGKKGYDYFRNSEDIEINNSYTNIYENLDFEHASEVADVLMDRFLDDTYDRIHIIYAQFKNAATQIYTNNQFLPISVMEQQEEATHSVSDFIFEPQKEELIQDLIPKILRTQIFSYLLDNNASENGARMVAMDQATENANELLGDLKLMYNRERQATITKEILEIVGGAAALEG